MHFELAITKKEWNDEEVEGGLYCVNARFWGRLLLLFLVPKSHDAICVSSEF